MDDREFRRLAGLIDTLQQKVRALEANRPQLEA